MIIVIRFNGYLEKPELHSLSAGPAPATEPAAFKFAGSARVGAGCQWRCMRHGLQATATVTVTRVFKFVDRDSEPAGSKARVPRTHCQWLAARAVRVTTEQLLDRVTRIIMTGLMMDSRQRRAGPGGRAAAGSGVRHRPATPVCEPLRPRIMIQSHPRLTRGLPLAQVKPHYSWSSTSRLYHDASPRLCMRRLLIPRRWRPSDRAAGGHGLLRPWAQCQCDDHELRFVAAGAAVPRR
jgi:hypothetical protein